MCVPWRLRLCRKLLLLYTAICLFTKAQTSNSLFYHFNMTRVLSFVHLFPYIVEL